MTGRHFARQLSLAAVVVCGVCDISAQSRDSGVAYAPPSTAVRFTAQAAAVMAQARTAALVAIDASRIEVTSYNPDKKEVVVVRRGGIRRAVNAEKAKQELMDSMREWNRFAIVDDGAQADVVIVVFEDTVEPSAFTRATGDRQHRMRERLAVFAPDRPDTPLWANEFRESTINALTGSAVSKVVDKLREEFDRATAPKR